ncbi:sulfatase-like hydrolase/transferase [Clostridium grantii]|uniref:Sulfatase n=1 Tax=Clostridium grantii DSM 8605 TaxID=1121316 RepID=A0A1M5SUQ8_9CLOT|nr:sulfatase-like hydrolase/transferase [Clostridium grantii]SHH42217.1 Sulfatase [Clostridium grantii DSM 8605]
MSKTNVVLIMADQLRADILGKDTPNINKIAADGVKFNRAYCDSPLCVPARGAFFTGTYPNVNGSIINPWFELDEAHGDVRKGVPNLYHMMEDSWDSWHSGKQHLYTEGGKIEHNADSKTNWIATDGSYVQYLKEHGKRKPGGNEYRGKVAEMVLGKYTRVREYSTPKTGCYEEGFDFFFDGYFANRAVEAIQKRDKSKPLLLNAMFLAPHPPLDIPEPWFSMYKDVELPENVGIWNKDQSPLQMYNLTGILGSRYSREDWKGIWPVYKGLVSLIDDCVGMIIDELKAQGIYDETMIIFTTDHGEMLGSHGLWQKMCMYFLPCVSI